MTKSEEPDLIYKGGARHNDEFVTFPLVSWVRCGT